MQIPQMRIVPSTEMKYYRAHCAFWELQLYQGVENGGGDAPSSLSKINICKKKCSMGPKKNKHTDNLWAVPALTLYVCVDFGREQLFFF